MATRHSTVKTIPAYLLLKAPGESRTLILCWLRRPVPYPLGDGGKLHYYQAPYTLKKYER